MNLTSLDILVVVIISILTSVLVTIIYVLINKRKCFFIDIISANKVFYGKGKNGYLEKNKKLNDKTTFVEINYILSIANNSSRPYSLRNMSIISHKSSKHKYKLEEGCLNLNGTSKSVAGVTSYEKLRHIIVKPYECLDYDVNIRLSIDEYKRYKIVYLSYIGSKNENRYIKLKIKN